MVKITECLAKLKNFCDFVVSLDWKCNDFKKTKYGWRMTNYDQYGKWFSIHPIVDIVNKSRSTVYDIVKNTKTKAEFLIKKWSVQGTS